MTVDSFSVCVPLSFVADDTTQECLEERKHADVASRTDNYLQRDAEHLLSAFSSCGSGLRDLYMYEEGKLHIPNKPDK